jgi:glycosyltransferase involved in cell wall biosynthesis
LTRPLRLAVDAHDLARDRRGIGTYVRALLSRFARRDDIALTLLVRDLFPARFAGVLRSAIGAPPNVRIRYASRVPRDADIAWHPWNGTFFASAPPSVATIHDVIPFALPAADDARRASQQAPFRRTAATAGTIVCDSAFTAADVERFLSVAPERLRTVALGVDPMFRPGQLNALPGALRGRRYVLYVGAHDPHKNVATLIKAHARAFPGGDVALVFTRPNPLAPGALVFERAAEPALVALYGAALLVAVPSVYEGFGLPLLEAMACGAPVLAARATALPEVGADVAAYVDEPRDERAWERALRDLAADAARRAAMGRAGAVHAATFTWDRCAERTLAILREAAVPQAADMIPSRRRERRAQ